MVERLGPEVTLRRSEHLYPVAGRSLASWLHAASLLGPLFGGRRYPAYTRWQVRWSYWPSQLPLGVAPRHIEVRGEVDLYLPEWLSSRHASVEERAAWDEWEQLLRAHERGHEAVGRGAVVAVHRALAALEPQATTAALARAAQHAVEAQLAEHRALDLAIDREVAA